MMMRLSGLSIVESQDTLKDIPEGKVLINTINVRKFVAKPAKSNRNWSR